MTRNKKRIPVAGTKPEPISANYFNMPRLPEPEVEEKDDVPNWRDRVREIVTPIWFDYHGSHFFDGDGKMIAQIRGWGGLTSSGLSDEEAREIQEKNAAYIVNAVNEHEAITADRDRYKRIAEELIEHYGDVNHWKNGDLSFMVDGFIANEYDFDLNGFDFAQAKQKELDQKTQPLD